MTGINGNRAPYEMIDPSKRERVAPLDITVVIIQTVVRVLLIITIWLLLCISVFLGFFTVPLLMLLGFALIYALFDLQRTLRKMLAAKRKKPESYGDRHPTG